MGLALAGTSGCSSSGGRDRGLPSGSPEVSEQQPDTDQALLSPARELASLLSCEVNEQRSSDDFGITYMAPVRSGIMADAAVCTLDDGETIHVFARPVEQRPLTDDELAHGFTHPPLPTDRASDDCSPWLVIGDHFVVQVGSDAASMAVADALGPQAQRVEPTASTPISLIVPGPCLASG